MADVYIKTVAGGQNLTPAGTDAILLDDGVAYKYALLSSLAPLFLSTPGQMFNGKLSVTVASNDLIVALVTSAGGTPSVDDPVYVNINGTVRTVTGALSKTLADGTNWFNAGGPELATKEIDYFAYLGYNATDGVVLGYSRIPYANLYSDFSETTTNGKYCAISTITNAVAGDNYVNIGRFAAILSAGAGYTWTVPTFTGANLIQRPIYETRFLNWTPIIVGFSSNPTDTIYRYRIVGSVVEFAVGQETAGTSNATSFTLSLPIALASVSNLTSGGVNFAAADNSVVLTTASRFLVTTVITFYSNMTTGAWTDSGGKRAKCEGSYPLI